MITYHCDICNKELLESQVTIERDDSLFDIIDIKHLCSECLNKIEGNFDLSDIQLRLKNSIKLLVIPKTEQQLAKEFIYWFYDLPWIKQEQHLKQWLDKNNYKKANELNTK